MTKGYLGPVGNLASPEPWACRAEKKGCPGTEVSQGPLVLWARRDRRAWLASQGSQGCPEKQVPKEYQGAAGSRGHWDYEAQRATEGTPLAFQGVSEIKGNEETLDFQVQEALTGQKASRGYRGRRATQDKKAFLEIAAQMDHQASLPLAFPEATRAFQVGRARVGYREPPVFLALPESKEPKAFLV